MLEAHARSNRAQVSTTPASLHEKRQRAEGGGALLGAWGVPAVPGAHLERHDAPRRHLGMAHPSRHLNTKRPAQKTRGSARRRRRGPLLGAWGVPAAPGAHFEGHDAPRRHLGMARPRRHLNTKRPQRKRRAATQRGGGEGGRAFWGAWGVPAAPGAHLEGHDAPRRHLGMARSRRHLNTKRPARKSVHDCPTVQQEPRHVEVAISGR